MQPTFIKTKLKNVITINEIITIHYFEYDKDFVFHGEKHNFWEMVYVDKGKVEVSRNNEKIVLNQGEIIFHEPNEFHSIKAFDSAPNFFVITFVCNSEFMHYFSKHHTVLDKSLKPFIASIIKEAEMTYRISGNNPSTKKLNSTNTADIGAEQLIKTYLEQFLIMLLRIILEKKETVIFPSREIMENNTVQKVKNYIEEHLTEKIKVSDVCNVIGFGKTYLSALFKKQCGQTIIAYQINKKIEKAKTLMQENKLSVSEVSDELCFDSPQYFSRVFKKITKMSPKEFKNSLKMF